MTDTSDLFRPFPKIPRLLRDAVVTEKIDGTNACVIVTDNGDVYAQSRNRVITPESDNYGFATWVYGNKEALARVLGPGHHFGEWWGAGIQRGYGLRTVKQFSLFNIHCWHDLRDELQSSVEHLNVVPVIGFGLFGTNLVENSLSLLRANGSHAAAGYPRPEGIVIRHQPSGHMFKVLLENDDIPKGKGLPNCA